MKDEIEKYLKSKHLYSERAVRNEQGVLIGLGELLNDFQSLSVTKEPVSDEVLAEKLMKEAMTRTSEEFGLDKLEIGFHDTIIKWMRSQLLPDSPNDLFKGGKNG